MATLVGGGASTHPTFAVGNHSKDRDPVLRPLVAHGRIASTTISLILPISGLTKPLPFG